ncbi:MAG: hypothetical protein ACWGMZ_11380 [Thermoguttaceae bacterium]
MATSIQAAILRLKEAYDYACDMHCDLWDFAVEMEELRSIGLSVKDLRWLVVNGYVRHAREITSRSDAARDFRPAQDLKFTKKTCFILTEAGLRLTTKVPGELGIKRAA